jgi:DNA-directed RNA polymerase specialized sigma24 family protein
VPDDATFSQLAAANAAFIWRMAVALSRDEAAAKRAMAKVIRLAETASEQWVEPTQAAAWFRRHTIQVLREQPLPTVANEPLRHESAKPILAAVRKLPRQQQEALFLTLGENLADRPLGVAMDCSVAAAQSHLAAGRRELDALAADVDPQWQAKVRAAYLAIEVPQSIVFKAAPRLRRSQRWAKRLLQWVALLVIVAMLGAAAWLLLTRLEV